MKTAGGSVVAYENWRESRDPRILDEIEAYNRIDCESTERLRDWLVSIRPPGPWPVPGAVSAPRAAAGDDGAEALRSCLDASGLADDRRNGLFNLGRFHEREAKPAWWAIFDSLGRDEDELIDDLDALAGLEAVAAPEQVKRSMVRHYRFPPQETKLREGQSANAPKDDGFKSVTIEHLDRASGGGSSRPVSSMPTY